MTTMTVAQLAKCAGTKSEYRRTVIGFCVDSRMVKSHDAFFALPGAKSDGHDFLKDVASKGASVAIVLKTYTGPDFGLPLIRVNCVLQFLQDLAKRKLAKLNPRIVAVTGSIGKTTTKEFITTLLRQRFKVASTPGNSNSQIGMPLAILNHLKGGEDIVVLEMGMTEPGQIANLVRMAPPDVALITSVELVHASHFEGVDEQETLSRIARAKAEILSHPKTQIGILHREIINFEELIRVGSCKKLTFSMGSPHADFFLKPSKSQMCIKYPEGEQTLKALKVLGAHNQQNFLAAVAVARYFGLDWSEITKGMQELALPERRLQRVEKEGIIFINDAYNACTQSMKSALQSLPKPESKGRRIAVIGEMVDLGKFSEKQHQEVGACALESVDQLFCFGKGCEPIWKLWKDAQRPVEWTTNRTELLEALRKELKPGDVVLLKGSRINDLCKVPEEL